MKISLVWQWMRRVNCLPPVGRWFSASYLTRIPPRRFQMGAFWCKIQDFYIAWLSALRASFSLRTWLAAYSATGLILTGIRSAMGPYPWIMALSVWHSAQRASCLSAVTAVTSPVSSSMRMGMPFPMAASIRPIWAGWRFIRFRRHRYTCPSY